MDVRLYRCRLGVNLHPRRQPCDGAQLLQFDDQIKSSKVAGYRPHRTSMRCMGDHVLLKLRIEGAPRFRSCVSSQAGCQMTYYLSASGRPPGHKAWGSTARHSFGQLSIVLRSISSFDLCAASAALQTSQTAARKSVATHEH